MLRLLNTVSVGWDQEQFEYSLLLLERKSYWGAVIHTNVFVVHMQLKLFFVQLDLTSDFIRVRWNQQSDSLSDFMSQMHTAPF